MFANANGEVYTYTYNADGIRTSKLICNADGGLTGTTEYIYDGTKLIAENRSGDWLYYFYDASGTVTGMSYNGTMYYFRKNLQGDVTGIYNATGNIIAQYEYTPYGAIFAITDANGNDISANATHIANINPFRYRSYYYDTETGLYYLQSRYYDPVVGRFLNADVIIGANGGIEGYNSFAYCNNNPVMKYDPTGYDAIVLTDTGVIGHTGIMVQDEEGVWYHFYWGPIFKPFAVYATGCKAETWCKEYKGEITLEAINASGRYADGEYSRLVYLCGDFSVCLDEMRNSSEEYNLYTNNCVSKSLLILSKADTIYRQALCIAAEKWRPNQAHLSLQKQVRDVILKNTCTYVLVNTMILWSKPLRSMTIQELTIGVAMYSNLED